MFALLKKFFGTKSEKDIKAIQPLVDKTLEIYPSLASLSNDEIRAKVTVLKQQIQDAIKNEQSQIQEMKARVENEIDMSLETKEDLYKEVACIFAKLVK